MSIKDKYPKGLVWFYVGIILIILSCYLIIKGVETGKLFPLSVIGFIINLGTFIFIPRKRFYPEENQQEEEGKKE
jgi:hypothetical protein